MKLLRMVLLTCLAFAATGCFTINVPEPPDVQIPTEVDAGQAEPAGEGDSSHE